MTFLIEKLRKRECRGNLRSLSQSEGLIDFASNDYLGLARSKTFIRHVLEEYKNINILGSTGSRLLTGNSAYAEQLEKNIAAFHGHETGTLFNCGYMANVGLLSAVAGKEDVIVFDSHIHASTHEGIRLSGAQAYPFRHNDVNHLETRLKSCSGKEIFLCIESIYSTDGSLSPLDDIYYLTERYGAHLIVDEAHAVGISGCKGKGLASPHLFARVVTFGKSLGTQGAIVLGNSFLKKYLINFARSYIYTTALPLQILIAINKSYELFPLMEEERSHVQKLIEMMHHITGSQTAIQPVIIPGNDQVMAKAAFLKKYGFDVRPLMSPTVQRGHEMLRICLHAFNTFDEVNSLLKFLCQPNITL